MEQEQNKKESIFKKPWIRSLMIIIFIFGLLSGFIFWLSTRNTVLIENSFLEAPVINLSPATPGILYALYVNEGDRITSNSPVALVGSQTIYSKDGGIVASAPKVIGSYFNVGQTVASVINDKEMKVVGAVDETKGLGSIKAGQRATFTVDAFSGKQYEGIVDEISPTSNDTGVVFNISDTRPVKSFDVKVVFDITKYPELKNGMSAKITVHTK